MSDATDAARDGRLEHADRAEDVHCRGQLHIVVEFTRSQFASEVIHGVGAVESRSERVPIKDAATHEARCAGSQAGVALRLGTGHVEDVDRPSAADELFGHRGSDEPHTAVVRARCTKNAPGRERNESPEDVCCR